MRLKGCLCALEPSLLNIWPDYDGEAPSHAAPNPGACGDASARQAVTVPPEQASHPILPACDPSSRIVALLRQRQRAARLAELPWQPSRRLARCAAASNRQAPDCACCSAVPGYTCAESPRIVSRTLEAQGRSCLEARCIGKRCGFKNKHVWSATAVGEIAGPIPSDCQSQPATTAYTMLRR
ncbi:hypothetical protein PsYK624_112130 [Phanerochaete sordida]|uniref:Uncharacterized protein n=1 Tax=Phanerochaete sordida TaxID=48140 RepID=A0A9P3LHV8_9APHY|nr:hypothetical protein PsYK624_112130 [Phanerochaete sordida]